MQYLRAARLTSGTASARPNDAAHGHSSGGNRQTLECRRDGKPMRTHPSPDHDEAANLLPLPQLDRRKKLTSRQSDCWQWSDTTTASADAPLPMSHRTPANRCARLDELGCGGLRVVMSRQEQNTRHSSNTYGQHHRRPAVIKQRLDRISHCFKVDTPRELLTCEFKQLSERKRLQSL